MINQISWAGYWFAVTVTVIIYYSGVFIRYYLPEIKQIIAGKSKLIFRKRASAEIANGDNNFIGLDRSDKLFNESKSAPSLKIDPSEQELFPIINQLVQEIKMMFEDAVLNNLIKEEIIYAIQLLLKKYPSVKDTPFESIVNNYILTECSNYCSIHLDNGEMNLLWV